MATGGRRRSGPGDGECNNSEASGRPWPAGEGRGTTEILRNSLARGCHRSWACCVCFVLRGWGRRNGLGAPERGVQSRTPTSEVVRRFETENRACGRKRLQVKCATFAVCRRGSQRVVNKQRDSLPSCKESQCPLTGCHEPEQKRDWRSLDRSSTEGHLGHAATAGRRPRTTSQQTVELDPNREREGKW